MEENIFYHILNRGVDKKKIFQDLNDYIYFMDNLFGLNNKNIALPYSYRKSKNHRNRIPMIKIVDIVCWCLMPNHFHSLVKEKINKGAGLFSKKITSSHTHYFNLKNDRNGVLFQGRSKILPVERDEYFLWLPFYIMSNPLKLVEPQWKEKGIKNLKKALEFLENYKYSSFPNLIGKNSFSEIINKNLFYKIYDTNEKKFKKDFIEFVSSARVDK